MLEREESGCLYCNCTKAQYRQELHSVFFAESVTLISETKFGGVKMPSLESAEGTESLTSLQFRDMQAKRAMDPI